MKKTLIIVGVVLVVAVIGYVVYIRLRKTGVIKGNTDCCGWDAKGNCTTKCDPKTGAAPTTGGPGK